jgi:serine protease Do
VGETTLTIPQPGSRPEIRKSLPRARAFARLVTMNACRVLALIALAAAISPLRGEAVKDREGAVRKDRATMQNDARWIYNDVPRGFAEARRTGRPLLVTLRCVPCVACMGIDASILTQPELAPLLDQFVCVRLINANALDLSLFQVDFDLSFSTVFFNGDRTVYGRFGSWQHQRNALDSDTAGFRRALEGALAVHRGYPGNKAALAGKQGVTLPFRTPVEMPLLATKYQRELDWNGKVVGSCVHCHQVGDALRAWYREQKQPVPTELIFPWPAPETVGISLAADQPTRVTAVAEGSSAARAGLQPGDELLALAGQPLISIADFSWVLHVAADPASIPVVTRRGTAERKLTLDLPSGWRHSTDNGKRVALWSMRGMATGGMVLDDLPDDVRGQRGLDTNQLALNVRSVGQYGNHAAAKKAGFEKDDVIVRIDGLDRRLGESELFAHLLQRRIPGEKVKATVLRGSGKVELELPMQ